MDYAILSWINNTFGSSKFIAILARIITNFGNTWFFIGFVVALLCFKKTRKVGFYIMIAGGFACLFNSCVIKLLIKRERPFVEHAELKNMYELAGIYVPKDYSMASGHAITSMALAVSVMFFSKKWGGIAIVYSILVGLSRNILCVHYPTDVLIGWILGAAIAVAMHYLIDVIWKIIVSKKENKNEKNSVGNKEST